MWDSISDAKEKPAEHGQVTMEHESILWGRGYLAGTRVEAVDKDPFLVES
jgi:hypothetical protein